MIVLPVVTLAGVGGVAGSAISPSSKEEPLAPIVVHAPAPPPPSAAASEVVEVPHPPPPANCGDVCFGGASNDWDDDDGPEDD